MTQNAEISLFRKAEFPLFSQIIPLFD